jgi:hypothetical protein
MTFAPHGILFYAVKNKCACYYCHYCYYYYYYYYYSYYYYYYCCCCAPAAETGKAQLVQGIAGVKNFLKM